MFMHSALENTLSAHKKRDLMAVRSLYYNLLLYLS